MTVKPAVRNLPPRRALAALLGKHLGHAVVTFAFPEESPEQGIFADTVPRMRLQAADAVGLIAGRFDFSVTARQRLTELIQRIRENFDFTELAAQARDVVVRLSSELKGVEGHETAVCLTAAYHLREVAIVTKYAGASRMSPDELVKFFGQEHNANILAYCLILIQAGLSYNWPDSEHLQILSKFTADMNSSMRDGHALAGICELLEDTLPTSFSDNVECVVPDGVDVVSTPAVLAAAFDFGAVSNLLYNMCRAFPYVPTISLASSFYTATALAQKLQIASDHHAEMERLVEQGGDSPSKELVMQLGELIRHELRYRGTTTVEILYGSEAKNLLLIGDHCGHFTALISGTMQGASMLGLGLVIDPEPLRKEFADLQLRLRRTLVPAGEQARIHAALDTVASIDPNDLDLKLLWEVVTHDIRELLANVYFSARAINPSIRAGLDGVDSEAAIPPHLAHLASAVSRVRSDFPNYERNVFIMMRFVNSPQHARIFATLQSELKKHGYYAIRADQKAWSDELWTNVCACMLASAKGIAIFEEINTREFNPNVALEVGFMAAMGKPVLLLKDAAMRTLPTDLVGKLYRPFDSFRIASVRKQVAAWLIEQRASVGA